MNVLKRISTGMSIAILTACAGLFILFGISGTGWKALSIPTGSMRPVMPPGSLVLVHSVPLSSLKVGDVITYTNPRNTKTTITHRIIKTYLIGGRIPGFVTKGDANKVADEPIAGGSVVGKVMTHLPYAGSWLLQSKTWVTVSFLVYLPAVLIMVEEVQRLAAYYRISFSYKLYGFWRFRKQPLSYGRAKYAAAGTLAAVVMVIGLAFVQPTLALTHISSNTVTLGPNRIAAGTITTGGGGTTCNGNTHNNTNINISNSNNQTATTGNASSNNNTSGGTATSGNATNNNSTSININVNNGC